MLHRIGPVLSFSQASLAAVPQLCGMALSSHTGPIPQNSCGFAVVWHAAVAVVYVCDGGNGSFS